MQDPRLKQLMDECTHGVVVQVTQAMIHGQVNNQALPFACMTVCLAAFTKIAAPAPPEVHALVLQLIDATRQTLVEKFGSPPETNKIVLPFGGPH